MIRPRRAAALGVAGAATVVVLLLAPYAVADARALGIYYGGDLVGPPLAGLFAAVAGIALASAERGRTDPPLAAGVGVVLGAFAGLLLVRWALGVSPSLVGGLTTVDLFEWHRWALALAGVALLGGGAAYARSVV